MTNRVRQVVLLLIATFSAGCSDPTAPLPGSIALGVFEVPLPELGEQIFIADADGAHQKLLTDGTNPSWSPDGQHIAFSRQGFLYVIDADGTRLRSLRKGRSPSWSPDGKRLAFTDSSGIAVMDSDASNVRTVIRHDFNPVTYKPWDMGVDKATWSPDGQRIAFEHLGDADIEPAQIYFVNVDGSQLMPLSRISRIRYAEYDPSWSPDGKKIVHWSFGNGIAATNVGDGSSAMIYANFPFVSHGARPDWSPDGREIVFNSIHWGGSRPLLYVVSSNGGALRLIVSNAYSADWSPDGSKIVFVRSNQSKQK